MLTLVSTFSHCYCFIAAIYRWIVPLTKKATVYSHSQVWVGKKLISHSSNMYPVFDLH